MLFDRLKASGRELGPCFNGSRIKAVSSKGGKGGSLGERCGHLLVGGSKRGSGSFVAGRCKPNLWSRAGG